MKKLFLALIVMGLLAVQLNAFAAQNGGYIHPAGHPQTFSEKVKKWAKDHLPGKKDESNPYVKPL